MPVLPPLRIGATVETTGMHFPNLVSHTQGQPSIKPFLNPKGLWRRRRGRRENKNKSHPSVADVIVYLRHRASISDS